MFLWRMIFCFRQNITRSKQGFRCTDETKLCAAYVRMISGRLAYETFKANAQHSVPSVKSVDRYIYKVKANVVEGVLRTSELSKYLTELNLPRIVALSEDATRITNRVQYDSQTNQLIGFVLPLAENGMPIANINIARSAAEMERCFYDVKTGEEKKRSSYLNVVMAQPLVPGVPAFCLLLFGSDSKYTSTDIEKRWQFIRAELKKNNIEVLTFASDSDPKFNSVMRNHMKLGQSKENNIDFPEWFNADIRLSDSFDIQDTVHIGTKCRNRMLNTTLKMGEHDVSVEHLESVMQLFTKEKHKLCPSILRPRDKQNFDSVLSICDEKVIDLLSHVNNSEGTILYLRVLSSILRSFLDLRLKPIERIRQIWFATFVLRIWKKFILESKNKYSVASNFMTSNCYSCIEINAHALIFLMLYLKEQTLDHLFHPDLLGSQQCEAIFRQIRSLSSTYSTVKNSSLLEIIQKMSKIELQNQISHMKLKHYNFPRIGLPSSSYYERVDRNGINQSENIVELPSHQEIIREIELAKLEAIEYAETLGMCLKSTNDYACKFQAVKYKVTPINTVDEKAQQDAHGFTTTDNSESEGAEGNDDILQLFPDMNFNAISKKIDPNTVTETGPYVKIKNKKGEIVCVEKHTLCWYLSKSTTKLSSDRLIRVMTKIP